MPKKFVRITHLPSGEVIAEGPVGWGITPFEGNWYISKKHLRTDGFSDERRARALRVQVRVHLAAFPARRPARCRDSSGGDTSFPTLSSPSSRSGVAVPGDHPEIEAKLTLPGPPAREPGSQTGHLPDVPPSLAEPEGEPHGSVLPLPTGDPSALLHEAIEGTK